MLWKKTWGEVRISFELKYQNKKYQLVCNSEVMVEQL
jgi:hypothetical protein